MQWGSEYKHTEVRGEKTTWKYKPKTKQKKEKQTKKQMKIKNLDWWSKPQDIWLTFESDKLRLNRRKKVYESSDDLYLEK